MGTRDVPGRTVVRPPDVRRLLGRAVDVVVLDLHEGVDADVLGQVHGLVWGGGRLVLRLGPEPPRDERLAVFPYRRDDVATRFFARLERALARSPAVVPPAPIGPATRPSGGTREQEVAVERIAAVLNGPEPGLVALLADRGRGKSAALGLALRAVRGRVAITAPSPEAAAEVLRFAPDAPFVDPLELAYGGAAYDALVVDEAAQLPVPLLERLVARHPEARVAFASTAHGYEGTGRGFVLRLLAHLRQGPRPLVELALREPIRWSAGDPLERLVFDVLALDAQPSRVVGPAEPALLDRDALAADERLLREVFGLLVHAHYRTTPEDLHRLLDAPNLAVHALLHAGHVVGASVVAREGGLPVEVCEALASGRQRIRGHALAETLVTHAGRTDAGRLAMVRSVRIAVHPDARRGGHGRRLVEHVHASSAPDLFGTLFGATPELLRFRRGLGYALVRVGVSRGARSGEPAAVMVRPVSPVAEALVAELRADLARDLPLQLALLDAEGELDPGLAEELSVDLPAPAPLDDAARDAIVAAWADGPRPYESAAFAVTGFVEAHADRLASLDDTGRRLIVARVLERRPWRAVARAAGLPTVPAAMRALRRAVRDLVSRT